MKKSLMILASVALGASMASAADVTSKNVVGFTTTSVDANKAKMLAMQFDKVGGGSMKLQDFPINPATSDGAVIQLAYLSGLNIMFNSYTCWAINPIDPQGPSGWFDDGLNYVGNTVEVPAGTGFWLIPSGNTNLSFNGEVAANDIQVSCQANKAIMVCNPYPVATLLKDMPITPGTSDGTVIQLAYLNGFNIMFNSYTCWAVNPIDPQGPSGWFDDGLNYVGDTVEVAVGQGFWLIPSFTSSITFTSPL